MSLVKIKLISWFLLEFSLCDAVTPRRSQRRVQKTNEATPEPPVETKRVPGPRSMARAVRKAKLDQTATEMNTTTTTKSELETTKSGISKAESTTDLESEVSLFKV